jgi:hypothetical protein
MQITGNEAACMGVDVMRRVEDSVKKGKKGVFYFALALNSFRSDPGNRRDLLGLECALSSFKGEIPHIACKMPFGPCPGGPAKTQHLSKRQIFYW